MKYFLENLRDYFKERIIGFFIVAAVCFVFWLIFSPKPDYEKEYNILKEDNELLQADYEDLRADYELLKEEYAIIENDCHETREEYDTLKNDYETEISHSEELQEKLDELERYFPNVYEQIAN